MAFHASTCPYCFCGCALLLHEEAGRLLASYPRASQAGRASLCIRGWNCTSSNSHPDRLAWPMVRAGGELVRVTWQEAVAQIASRLSRTAAPPLVTVGPSLASEDAFAWRRLAETIGGRLCTTDLSGAPAARRAMRQVLGRGYGIGGLETIAAADLIWVIGADLDECPQVGSSVNEARRAGGVVVAFDVHAPGPGDGARTVTLPPGRFGWLAESLQRAAIAGGLAAPETHFVEGYDALEGHHRTAPPAAAPGGGPADDEVLALARQFRAATRPLAIVGSRWLTSASAEEDTVQLLQALALLGAADRILPAVGEANSWGCLDVLGPDLPPADLACRDEKIDTLIVVGDDLVCRSPRPDVLAGRLDRFETVVVVDRFASDTLPFADIVLPSCTFAEADGTVTSVFGTVQRWRGVVTPPGDCVPERVWASRIGGLVGGEQRDDLTALEQDAALRFDPETRLVFSVPGDSQTPAVDVADPSFPMRLVLGSHPANWSTGALSQREELLRREVLESTVAASPEVLKQLGIKPGWPARLLVPEGEATVTARADPRLPPGVLVLVPIAGSPAVRLRGFYPGRGGRSVGVQPVPARLERA